MEPPEYIYFRDHRFISTARLEVVTASPEGYLGYETCTGLFWWVPTCNVVDDFEQWVMEVRDGTVLS